MFPAFLLTAWVLAAPRQADLRDTPPREALFLTVPVPSAPARHALGVTVPAGKPPEPDLMRVWMNQLAVVKPHRPDRLAPPTLQMFIAPRGLGVAAFGVF
jgi:hypothetical protein